MNKVKNELVIKVITAMKNHNACDYFDKMNTHVLDMKKGFLFFNHVTGCLYQGFSIVEKPSYLSCEAQRMSGHVNYTIGVKEGIYKVYDKRTEDDFNKLYDQIINSQ